MKVRGEDDMAERENCWRWRVFGREIKEGEVRERVAR